jgi:transmembrane sensor
LFDRILERFRPAREQAAYWHIRRMDEPTMDLQDRQKLLTWLRRSPKNVSEVLRASTVEYMLRMYKLGQVESDASIALDGDATQNTAPQPAHVATVASLDNKPRENPPIRPPRHWKIAAMAAGLALTTLLAIVASEPRIDGAIATGAGQRQDIALSDGSIAHVGANTELAVDFGDARRTIHLYRGEAVFDVAKDATRPFVVTTSLIDTTAIGTRFGLSIDSGVTATVSEGVVKITDHDNPENGKHTILRAGQQLRVSADELADPVLAQVDAVRALEWANGWLEFQGKTIGEAAREFNRRNVVQIEIEHPEIAALAMSGLHRFPVDSPAKFARTIAAQNGLALTEDRSGKVVRLRLSEHRLP